MCILCTPIVKRIFEQSLNSHQERKPMRLGLDLNFYG